MCYQWGALNNINNIMYLCINIYTVLEIWGEEKYMHVNGVTGKGELNPHLSRKSMDNMQHWKKKLYIYLI